MASSASRQYLAAAGTRHGACRTRRHNFTRRGSCASLSPVFKDLFIETNPIPVKAALAMAGRMQEGTALPLRQWAQRAKGAARTDLAHVRIFERMKKTNVVICGAEGRMETPCRARKKTPRSLSRAP